DPAAGAQVGALLSQDLDAAAGQARAGLVVVRLVADLPEDVRMDVELALRDAVADLDVEGVTLSPLSEYILTDSLMEDLDTQLPLLLGLAFALIIAILMLTYRRVGDVVLSLSGLVVVIVWTYGLGVLLGPGYLGVTGELTQVSSVIPVLLIGLAVDYAIHLTSRYREEMTEGAPPPAAARAAVLSVGGALVLATMTTMIGFLTNLISPLPPLRDFGLFVAVGVLSAFVVMVLLVPSVRTLVDRRRVARGRFKQPASGTGTGLGRAMSRAAVLAERHAKATLAVAAVVTVAATGAATQVSTSFSQEDFIPEDSEIGELLTTFTDQFGGDVEETTQVLLEGPLDEPDAMNALLEAQDRMATTDGVRGTDGFAQVTSPASVLLALAAEPGLGQALGALGLAEDGFAADADVPAMLDLARDVAPELVDRVVSTGADAGVLVIETFAGQDGAVELREALLTDLDPVRDAGVEVTVVSEMLLYDETLEALTDSQVRGIALTLGVAGLVLVTFFAVRHRHPVLGLVTIAPSVLVVTWVLGSMWVLGISFNVMTAMVASLAIGIGVPYGIHVTNRFVEELAIPGADVDTAIRRTVTHTGSALLGSAGTTAAGFGVLAFASLVPMQQFGIITALTIVYSLLAAVLVEPACLKLWADRRRRA
ncbi:hypothetical protein N869_03575, partial [Cellulomonas bogoriensis 69B4 = DSM 16987]